MNTRALNVALQLGKKGADLKSQLLLLIIGILNQSANWPKTNLLLRRISSLICKNGIVRICIKNNKKKVNFILRENNNADYQSLFECFAGMYKIPTRHIQYILDGGANLGFFSINQYIENDEIREIICVEPNPFNLIHLTSNVEQLPAKIVNAALSNFNGAAIFNFKEHNTGHMAGSPGHNYFHNQAKINCSTIADVIPSDWNMENTLVKLDIEGQEYNVFMDMFTLNMFPRYIAAELHDYLNAGGEELINSFRKNGYEVIIDGNGMEGNVCRQIFAERKNYSL